tara:strand:- start:194 stop:379 length:186 start_codon:yes stop_codon:yes gene_type:complete
MIVINNNSDNQVDDRVVRKASHVYIANKDGSYATLKSRQQEESTSYSHDELMARVMELTSS